MLEVTHEYEYKIRSIEKKMKSYLVAVNQTYDVTLKSIIKYT